MLETVHEVFAGIVKPAFMTIIEFHQQNIRGVIDDGEPRDKQCETFHDKVREMTKGKLETNGLFDTIQVSPDLELEQNRLSNSFLFNFIDGMFYRLTVYHSRKIGLNVGFVPS